MPLPCSLIVSLLLSSSLLAARGVDLTPHLIQPAQQTDTAQTGYVRPAEARLPTVFLAGNAESLPPALLDPHKSNLFRAIEPGVSTRQFVHSGQWGQVLGQIKPGDFVVLSFNFASLQDQSDAVRTLEGFGDGTFDYLDPGTHKVELVHSYGWYLRRMVVDVIAHGGSPILCTPASIAVRAGQPSASAAAAGWARYIATEERIPYLDLSSNPYARQALNQLNPDPLQAYLAADEKQP